MIGRTVVRQYTKSARESTYVEFRRLSRTMASLAENDALSCKINGPISINVLKESNSGRLNPIRRWDMTPATGKISEGQIDLDEDECPPAISIAGTDEDIMQILKQRLTVRDAEVLGRCQVKWANDQTKIALDQLFRELQKAPQEL
ncbi:Oidioi.mRNA.OKI2018_I69.chr2.g5656.t1.cds [Oikopleura dioica]|uniref:Oidioi.mRNA.OKI2018_I69.chr2.g5656.t1.cds n=1 Tax=Oikopleura dioica TaxID=34765 RepID=A0ABN7TA38_OIKDI|nr:Oidioi.mRNA.OKI2018_I69.chr2.g5656.t1.cds [Oikopleura dioica]